MHIYNLRWLAKLNFDPEVWVLREIWLNIQYLEVNQDIFLGPLNNFKRFVVIQPSSWRLVLSFESWDSLESFYLSFPELNVHGCIQGQVLSVFFSDINHYPFI